MKVTFECEVDLKGDERISAIELRVKRFDENADVFDEHFEQELYFVFPRPTKVREGKHLRINRGYCEVVEVGETT